MNPIVSILQDLYAVSNACGTRTYIWGGLVPDILTGEFLREHRDIDGFTLRLWELKDRMTVLYTQCGYTVSFLEDVRFLKIERDGFHAVLNQLEFEADQALWRHAGPEGTLYFPKAWLSETSHRFYDADVFVSGIEFEYCIKTHPHLLNPEWTGRDKDIAFLAWLTRVVDDPESILKQIWSYTPYWVKKGYPAYSMPVVASMLKPL